MVETLSELVPRVLERLPEQRSELTPAQLAEEAARASAARREKIGRQLNWLMALVGPRYHNASLDNYEAESEPQKKALAQLSAYVANWQNEVRAGHGILLYGSTGTGKDHLLIGLARELILNGCQILWVNGIDLQARMREAIRTNDGEDRVLDGYWDARVLVLSDPMPPSGVLTDYQAATLYRMIDHRYRHLLPVWCSLNVADAQEARERLGAAIVDRLRDGALAIECNWPSYRKARR